MQIKDFINFEKKENKYAIAALFELVLCKSTFNSLNYTCNSIHVNKYPNLTNMWLYYFLRSLWIMKNMDVFKIYLFFFFFTLSKYAYYWFWFVPVRSCFNSHNYFLNALKFIILFMSTKACFVLKIMYVDYNCVHRHTHAFQYVVVCIN